MTHALAVIAHASLIRMAGQPRVLLALAMLCLIGIGVLTGFRHERHRGDGKRRRPDPRDDRTSRRPPKP